MAIPSRGGAGMTLDQFLEWPRFDEPPPLESADGRIEVKVSSRRKHSVIEKRLTRALDQFAEPSGLGAASPELRRTFGGRSVVPDVVFQLEAHIPRDGHGHLLDESTVPPDIQVDIRSPGQASNETVAKPRHSLAHGCPPGWFIDPERRAIDVHRPGRSPERLSEDGHLDGAPVLPGSRPMVAEVFGRLQLRPEGPVGTEADPR